MPWLHRGFDNQISYVLVVGMANVNKLTILLGSASNIVKQWVRNLKYWIQKNPRFNHLQTFCMHACILCIYSHINIHVIFIMVDTHVVTWLIFIYLLINALQQVCRTTGPTACLKICTTCDIAFTYRTDTFDHSHDVVHYIVAKP